MSASELDCRWHFAPAEGGLDQGPNDAMSEFFRKNPYESLVREAIQNSLDAVQNPEEPVQVVFSWRRMIGEEHPGLFAIRDNFKACLDFWKRSAAQEKFLPMIQYIDENLAGGVFSLEVSDSNTTGMDYTPGDRSCPFYSFVRSAGNSSKNNNSAGGSFGFGKAAYFNVSKILSILVSSRTSSGSSVFEGVSTICTHEIDGKRRSHVGFYDNNDGEPISDINKIPEMYRRDIPGTSVHIVGVEQNEGYDEIINAVLVHFWLSILEGKLVVIVKRNNDGQIWNEEESVTIDKDSLEALLEKQFPDGPDKIRGHANPRPYYEAVKYADKDKYHRFVKDYLPILGSVRFYINRQEQVTDRISYMRSPRMLVYNKPNNSGFGFYGVFVCDDEKGNEILRQTENPSHSEWDANNCNERKKREGRDALAEMRAFIEQSLGKIFSTAGATRLDIAGLDEFLYLSSEYEENDEYSTEALTGAPTGEVQDEGTSVTTELSDPTPFSAPAPEVKTSTGHVLVNYRSTAENAELGELYSGHSTKPVKKTGTGEPSSKLPSSPHQESEENGKMGTYAYPIDVNYRSFAQVEDGIVYHVIIIHSDIDVEDGQVVIFTGGEQDDERLAVTETSIGTAIDNTVVGLKLHNGKNTLKVRLADDMKHAIKLEAYENK